MRKEFCGFKYTDMKSVCWEVCDFVWICFQVEHISDTYTMFFVMAECGVSSAPKLVLENLDKDNKLNVMNCKNLRGNLYGCSFICFSRRVMKCG